MLWPPFAGFRHARVSACCRKFYVPFLVEAGAASPARVSACLSAASFSIVGTINCVQEAPLSSATLVVNKPSKLCTLAPFIGGLKCWLGIQLPDLPLCPLRACILHAGGLRALGSCVPACS